jgi:hypothetical protein
MLIFIGKLIKTTLALALAPRMNIKSEKASPQHFENVEKFFASQFI